MFTLVFFAEQNSVDLSFASLPNINKPLEILRVCVWKKGMQV